MATSVRQLRRYVWLVDTIRRAGNISLQDINDAWSRNYTINSDHESEIPERTFHRHRDAIAELFGVEILCDRSSNTYYIKDQSNLQRSSLSNWLFNGIALDNILISHEDVKKRILFEDTPGGMEHMPEIVEAMSENRCLSFIYRSYNNAEETQWTLEPRGLKQYRRRWYLIGNKPGDNTLLTFALDRIQSLDISDAHFKQDPELNLEELFEEVVGVFVDPELDAEEVVVRVFGKQRRYFDGTPLHHSQTIINSTANYTDYRLFLRPEYELQHEILRLGPDAEVISPKWLRDEITWLAEETLKRYNSTAK